MISSMVKTTEALFKLLIFILCWSITFLTLCYFSFLSYPTLDGKSLGTLFHK